MVQGIPVDREGRGSTPSPPTVIRVSSFGKMTPIAYSLYSQKSDKYYIGHTADMAGRLKRRNYDL